MKKLTAKQFLHRFSVLLEYLIAGLLCFAVLYFSLQLAGGIFHLPGFPLYEDFDNVLNAAFTLVIGIEIIRMMCGHSSEVVFEVLTFAIARQIVIDHSHAIDNLYGLGAIAILFIIRKYLVLQSGSAEKHPEEPSRSVSGPE